MTANFSQADAGLKDMISNIRSFGKAAEFAGESGSKAVSKFIKEMSEVDSKAVTTQQRLSAMGTVLKEQEMWYNRMGASAKKAFGQELQASIEEARKKVAQYNAELQGVGAGPSTGGGIGAFGVTKGMIAYQVLMKAVQLGKQTFQYAINTNMDFEQSNATLAAVLGTTRDKVADLTEQAKKLGASTQYTAGQIVGLQTELARLGFMQSQIKAMTEGVTNLSIATGIDLSRAANIAGSTIRAFNLPASEAERVVSALAVSTTKSALTMETLSTSLPYAASQAKQFGFTLEDTLALLGTLANAGFKASNQGMAVRNILSAIANDSSKLSRAMGMPIKTLDDFVAGLNKMKAEGANLNDIASIIEVRVGPALSRFVDAADDVKKLRDQLKDCTGEFDAMTAEMKNTAKFAKIEMKSAWDSLMLTFDESNGTLKQTYEWFTKIINKWIEFRKMRQGGDSAISLFEKGIGTDEAKAKISAGIGKYDSKDIAKALEGAQKGEGAVIEKLDKTIAFATEQMNKYYALKNELDMARRGGDVERAVDIMSKIERLKNTFSLRYDGEGGLPISDITKLPEYIAGLKDQRAVSQAIIDHFVAKQQEIDNAPGAGAGYRDKYSSSGSEKTIAEEAAEKVANALGAYESAINLATEEFKQDAIDSKSFLSKKQSAQERVYKAYYDAYELTGNEEYKKAMQEWIAKVVETAGNQGELSNSLKALAEKWKKEAEDKKALVAADRMVAGGIQSAVGSNAWNLISQIDGGALRGRFDQMKLQLSQGVEIPNEVWEQFVADMNEKLKGLNLPTIKLNLDTNTVTKELTQLEAFSKSMSDWQKGFNGIVSGVDAVTNVIETMQSAVEGNASAWDVMKSAINGAFTVMNSVVTVLELVNTLSTIHAAIKGKETADTIAQTAATDALAASEGVQAGTATTQAVANTAVAETGIAAAQGLMAEANAAIAAAHAPIPLVGPALAAAGMTTVTSAYAGANAGALAATQMMHFADGGRVPGAYNGGRDTVHAMLSPGEIILNRSMQENLAPQLLGSARQSGGGSAQPYVNGEQIWLGLNNYLQRTGRGEIVTSRR